MTIYKRENTALIIPQGVMDGLAALTQERKRELADNSISIDIILHVSGGDALVMQDAWGRYRATVDFDEASNWEQVVEALRNCENLLEDE